MQPLVHSKLSKVKFRESIKVMKLRINVKSKVYKLAEGKCGLMFTNNDVINFVSLLRLRVRRVQVRPRTRVCFDEPKLELRFRFPPTRVRIGSRY